MASTGGSQSTAFYGDGINHPVNAGRGNDNSVTLGGSLRAVSDHWAAMTPHAVLAATVGAGAGDDGAFERYERAGSAYDAGSLPEMSDQLTSGTNDNTP
jgi:hypothetical protein